MFGCMEITEAIYKGETTSKNTPGAESKRGIFGRHKKGGAYASPFNPNQGCTGKLKTSNTGKLSDDPTGAKKTCLMYGPGHSSEECKVTHKYTNKRSAQLTYQYK